MSYSHRELKSLVNKYICQEKSFHKYTSNMKLLENSIKSYLKTKDLTSVTIKIAGGITVLVSNENIQNFILKNDSAATVRRKIPVKYLDNVISTKEYVDLDVLKKLVAMDKVSKDVLDEILKTEEVSEFVIEVK